MKIPTLREREREIKYMWQKVDPLRCAPWMGMAEDWTRKKA